MENNTGDATLNDETNNSNPLQQHNGWTNENKKEGGREHEGETQEAGQEV